MRSESVVVSTDMAQEQAHAREELLFEYGELRKEFLQNDQMTLQMLGFVLAFAGTALTLAFGQWLQNPPVASAAFLVTEGAAIAAAFQTLDRARNTFMKAAYMRVFTEPALPV